MNPPNSAPIDMRHTKLKAAEAALLAGELVKPTWASKNEGIHERVSFEDTLWGFEMAGGAYYKTPLRVVYVRPGSRAEHACIRMGDQVLRINGQDTSDLTLQEAHKLVLEAGINLKIAVTSPEDKVNAHYDYEDPLNQSPVLTPEQLKEMDLERVRRALERASRCRDLPWPWVRRKWVIYKESNCYMVPSKYENKHREKFPELPVQDLDNFFPAKKINHAKNSKTSKDDAKNTKENEVTEHLEEEEEFEEIEEEVEEEVEEEEEVEVENEKESFKQDSSERLENENIENSGDSSDKIDSNHILEENNSTSLEHKEKLNTNISSENIQQKDSDQESISNSEVDNTKNHIVKSKNEQINETSPEHNPDDKIIDEIVQNGLVDVEENVAKTDDDIIDSVLKSDVESKDSENER